VASAGKCRVEFTFWYYLQEYVVAFTAEPSDTIISTDNQRHSMFEVRQNMSYYFKYDIHHVCKDRNDCAQDFARTTITEMLTRQINYLSIITEVRPLVLIDPQSPNTTDLACFDAKENVGQCAVPTKGGSCVISDNLLENGITSYCKNDTRTSLAYLNITDTGSYATFDVHCDRPLCNGQTTLKAAKDILFKYGLTKTPEGRLNNGSQFIKISIWLIVSLLIILN
jgi:hypothetical protein